MPLVGCRCRLRCRQEFSFDPASVLGLLLADDPVEEADFVFVPELDNLDSMSGCDELVVLEEGAVSPF
jgi:hypothetical protein